MVDSRMRYSRIIRTFSRINAVEISLVKSCVICTRGAIILRSPAHAIRKRMNMLLKSLTCFEEVYDFNSTRNASDSLSFLLPHYRRHQKVEIYISSSLQSRQRMSHRSEYLCEWRGIRFNLVGLAQT